MKKISKYLKQVILTAIIFGFVTFSAVAKDDREDINQRLAMFAYVMEVIYQNYHEEIGKEEIINNALRGMLSNMDPYSTYLDAEDFKKIQEATEGSFGGIGIQINKEEGGYVKVISPIDGTPAHKAGIKAGDFISHIDGVSVADLTIFKAVEMMKGKEGTKLTIKVVRGILPPFEVELTRAKIRTAPIKYEIKENNIAYIRVPSFDEKTHEELEKAIKSLQKQNKNIKGYILDLRNNPGGLLNQAVSLADSFLDEGEIVSIRPRNKEQINRFYATKGDIIDGKPLVILINHGSASASEIVAGSLQDNKRALLVGKTSFGKGSVQTVLPLGRTNEAIKLTIALYYTPSGKVIHGNGVSPDFYVYETGKTCKQDCSAEDKAKLNNEEFKMIYDNYINNKTTEEDKQIDYAVKLLKEYK